MRVIIYYCSVLVFLFSQVSFAEQASSKEPVQRIIALAPHSVEILFSIGAGDRIIATTDYADYPQAALNIPRVGSHNGIQIERVVELKPDLIIVWESGNKLVDIQKLKSLGFNIFYTRPNKISHISDEIRRLGELTGLQQRARKIIDQLETKHHQIKNKYKSKSKVKTFYQLWHKPLTSVGPDSWVESLLNDCHAENIFHNASSSYPVVSIESVLVKNPQVIIIPHHSGDKEIVSETKTDIWQKWSEISAVKNDQIYVLNGDLLHRFTPRALDGLQKLCEDIDKAR